MWYRLNENVWKLEVASVTRTSKIKNYIFKAVFLTYQVLMTCYYLTKIIPVKKNKFFYKDIGHLSLKVYQCVFMRCVLYICIFVYVYICICIYYLYIKLKICSPGF